MEKGKSRGRKKLGFGIKLCLVAIAVYCGAAVFGAMIRDYTPHGKAGMFQGLRICGQVLSPGVVGPAVGAAVLKNAATVLNDDGTTSFVPNNTIFLAALIAAVVLLPLIRFCKKEKTQ